MKTIFAPLDGALTVVKKINAILPWLVYSPTGTAIDTIIVRIRDQIMDRKLKKEMVGEDTDHGVVYFKICLIEMGLNKMLFEKWSVKTPTMGIAVFY